MFPANAPRKGTLAAGQTISVNNYTVQVERYLSQGGFAHVYLVRTPTPVYNTTHHVLKRIAVANEAMLTEVKKEVDVMRLLKGHPNIVHFIDASWHKLPNGSFEVFILMEYCPGGGIIDMMNRRLRERLTEAEILQIFVDVCEGVAYMHNSRPPLLHRDLKVENILQSSPASFKLCDFGSATTISTSPSNVQEIRALEADLNKHTTLQYRAPEMVDVYSKRPINEKSDVWALGVLLYKLCYYTTPFEEHGPLAILNVQYRTPAFPSYSQDMHMLIASMLREHGAQRPTVFELLAHVHRLRGTKSKFSYTIPVGQPPLSRFTQATPLMPNNSPGGPVSHSASSTKPALSVYNADKQSAISNEGVQAREKVLEAIAPMRRGRPTHMKEGSSRQPSPQMPQQTTVANNWQDRGFSTEENQAWKTAKEKAKVPSKDDVWAVVSPQTNKVDASRPVGFGDDFAEKLWTTSDPNSDSRKASPQRNATSPASNGTNEISVITPLAFTGSRMLRPRQDRIIPNRDKGKDAFDGLGLMTPSVKPAPTLGEARKLRTGLAVMSSPVPPQGDYLRSSTDKNTSGSPRPTPSPRQTYLSPTSSHLPSVSPVSSNSSLGTTRPTNTSSLPSSGVTDGLPIESRFPSLEELDARLGSSANSLYSFVINDSSKKYTSQFRPADPRSYPLKPKVTNQVASDTGEQTSRANVFSNVLYNVNSLKSDQVVGVASKDTTERNRQDHNSSGIAKSIQSSSLASVAHQRRPSLIRKHRSSVTMKPNTFINSRTEETEETSVSKLPSQTLSDTTPRDWLTGDDHEDFSKPSRSVPVLRESPSKRASFIAQSDLIIPESSSVQHVSRADQQSDELSSSDLSPTTSKFKRAFPNLEKVDVLRERSDVSSNLSGVRRFIATEVEHDSSSDDGPEEVGGLQTTSQTVQRKSPGRGMTRQGSVHDLVNQYGGRLLSKEKESEPETTQSDDFIPRKSQAGGLAPPIKQVSERKAPSSTSLSPGLSSKSSHRPQPSSSAQRPPAPSMSTKPSLSSSRTRPQSMFIFPSKAIELSYTTPSSEGNNLMPPTEPNPRPPRRLSISDMVQKYEAINAKTTSSLPAPPSPVRPVSSKAILSASNGQKLAGDSDRVPITSQSQELGSNFARPQSDAYKQHTNLEPMSKPGKVLNRKPTLSTTSPRKLSIKAAPTIITSNNRTDPLAAARAAKSSGLQRDSLDTSQISRSPRKRTLSIPSNPTSKTKDDMNSPAENEAYQGVSRLIDQWQKKSAEAEHFRPLSSKKHAFTAKRTGNS